MKAAAVAEPAGADSPVYVRAKTGAKRLDVSLATWWRMVADGRLPRGTNLGVGVTLWKWADVEAAVAAAAEQDGSR